MIGGLCSQRVGGECRSVSLALLIFKYKLKKERVEFMGELIKIKEENGKQLVSARELYDGLGMDRKNWSKWHSRNIEGNEYFLENNDWIKVVMSTTSKTGQTQTDFAISLEFAKHLAMMSKTEKSHEYRNYFIACENKLKEVNLKGNLLLAIYNGNAKSPLL